jgi:transcriptional regulator of acetoin/glycerol metabolism
LEQLLSRHENLITVARPLFMRLHQLLSDQSSVFILTDAHARIIELYAASEILYRLSQREVRPGASLQEEICGTNAMALALRYREPVIIRGKQHFARLFEDWCCIAAPVVGSAREPVACLDLSMSHEARLGEVLPLVCMLAERLFPGESHDGATRHAPFLISPKPPKLSLGPTFTARERESLTLLCAGKSTKEIAQATALSPDTVKSHLKRIYAKLEVHTRVEAVRRCAAIARQCDIDCQLDQPI